MASSIPLRVIRFVLSPIAALSERWGNRFYIGLGVLVLIAALYGILMGMSGGMKHHAYDLLMRSRFRVPPVDSSMVLVDIDEASLAAMAPEYGRWPWPRAVMAELVEGIARDRPAAIVFDIAFSDLDINHPDGDRYFRDVVQRERNTYFAMIRLNPENDADSELRLAQIAGAQSSGVHALPEATVAMVVPYFWNVLDGRRLGTNNLYVDDDGTARAYHVYRDIGDWRLYSLPANVAASLGATLPEQPDILLNWRGRPPSYPAVSFYTVYDGLLKQGRQPTGVFNGKVVVIGSTAPSLFDLKPSPVAQNHPGVEILMTAIDNLRNADYLTELPSWIYLIVTLVAIVLLTLAFVYNVDPLWLYTLFTVMQTAFLGVTFLFLNYSTWFVDLTAPFTAALAYFFIARLYRRVLVGRRNGAPWYSAAFDVGASSQAFLVACRFHTPHSRRQSRAGAILQREAGLTRYGAAAARPFAGAPLVDGIYDDTMLLYWLVAPPQRCRALQDLLAMLHRSLKKLEHRGLVQELTLALHAVAIDVAANNDWRSRAKGAIVETLELAASTREPFNTTRAFEDACRECSVVSALPSLRRLD